MPCRNSGNRWNVFTFPRSLFIPVQSTFCILSFISFYSTFAYLSTPWNKPHKLIIISSTSSFLNIAFLLSQIRLLISAPFWYEKLLLWIFGCISYISINLSEPLFQTWCKQWTLCSQCSLGPYNCSGQKAFSVTFVDSLDIFRYTFMYSENYFLTLYELSD